MDYIKWNDLNKRLAGATVIVAEQTNTHEGDEIIVVTDKGTIRMRHDQDYCESVYVEDIAGSLADLVDGQIVLIEERINPKDFDGSQIAGFAWSETWTFYEIRTTKGDVTIRWCGLSSGYYSESVTVTLDGVYVS